MFISADIPRFAAVPPEQLVAASEPKTPEQESEQWIEDRRVIGVGLVPIAALRSSP